MIETPWLYLGIVTLLGGGLWAVEIRSRLKLFTWLPAIVLIYLLALALSQSGILAGTPEQNAVYKTAKSWLLPTMLFLMMLRLELGAFARLGKKLLIAYTGAVLSLAGAFVLVFTLFGFGPDAAGVFGALSGSWTGGTANMLAVAGALDISDTQMGPALVVDSLLYTLWVMTLLFAVPFAARFDRWSGADPLEHGGGNLTGFERPSLRSVTVLLFIAATVALFSQALAPVLPWLSRTTWLVLTATGLGLLASLTPLRRLGGSPLLGSFLLYVLIALIGSHASLSGFSDVPKYLAAGAAILLLHAGIMLLLARTFHLNLFSIGVASLANIGGVASAPVLAAAYHRSLVGVAVLMAVTGYLIGTVAGLGIASVLKALAT